MWINIGSVETQFFRDITEIQSEPDVFNESRFFMPFWVILRVTEILYSYRLVLEGKTGREIPESSRLVFLGKFLANNFAVIDE